MIFMLIALEIKFELASLFREKALDRGVAPSQFGRNSGFPPKIRLIQLMRVSAPPSFTIKRLAAEAAWMPAVGNVSTVLCFIICLILNMHLTFLAQIVQYFSLHQSFCFWTRTLIFLLVLVTDKEIFQWQWLFLATWSWLLYTGYGRRGNAGWGVSNWRAWMVFSRLRMLLFLFSPCLTTFSSTALCGTMWSRQTQCYCWQCH